jgi:PAS domain S-box-containing protein
MPTKRRANICSSITLAGVRGVCKCIVVIIDEHCHIDFQEGRHMPAYLPSQKSAVQARCLIYILGILLFATGVSFASTREIKVGIYENYPKVFTDSNGTPAGIFVDIIEDIAQSESWSLQYVHGSWPKCLEHLESGAIDLMPDVAYSPERAELYDLCKEAVLSNWAQVYTRSGVSVDVITDLAGMRIATLQGGIHHEEFKNLAENFDFRYSMTLVDDYKEVFRLLHEKQIDVGIVNRIFGFAHEDRYDVVRNPVMFSPASLRFAVLKGSNMDVIAAIDRHLVAMKAEKASAYHRSLNQWLGVTSKLTIPPWIGRSLVATGIGLLLLLVLSVLLKYQVNRKTVHLRLANAQLEEQVSKTMKAEVALRKSEKKWRSLVEHIHDIIFINDYEVNVLYANPALEEQTGLTIEDIKPPASESPFIHPDDAELAAKTVKEFATSLKKYSGSFEIRIIDKWGHVRWISTGIAKLEYEGKPALLYVGHDMTPRKKAEIALQDALAEVRALKNRLQEENIYLKEEIRLEHNFDEIVGQNRVLKAVLEKVEQVAATDAMALIQGETGTGKELIARAIHERSQRGDRPMIKVNCSAIPKELFESEFFGHVKGAFTGALKDRIGRFQLADGGTLFLDEVGEIPYELQGKLLRVLQEGQFEKVGEDKTKTVNVRIISSTNRNLEEEIEKKNFRQDLYFRLSVFPIEMPPLRDRLDDIPDLSHHFMKKICRKIGVPEVALNQGHFRLLQQYSWPGNIRELENVIEQALITARNGQFNIILPDSDKKGEPEAMSSARTDEGQVLTQEELHNIEVQNVVNALDQADWKIYGPGGAAELLGIKPSTLTSRIKIWGIEREK